ncbi:MAG: polymer-forming cytoskeletal protein [Pseudomonadales bacterium]|nr:polymer-forming cytoskeletal protein [Pseudomonadales bacterium]MDP6469956.1 polymer-forming cytoskeletal protein [Pseudomonadales bacterium]MDP6829123.1 polymer-forming cytoskeletal protein [Pseudomonadales bacterium]MDP6971779.1 polymer-forming cytoskeletal protein [Pseudomonadales bacterium]|tara:strand:- start:2556 stop:3068 length:513 start_codon:yes stop_codon:yes gene_type:complete
MFDKRKQAALADAQESEAVSAPSPDPIAAEPRPAAVIGLSIRITGKITGAENLVIAGSVQGEISLLDNDVTVSEPGNIQANINAKVIRVDGEVQGDLSGGENVIISNTGKVNGNIVSPRVTLEDGALFKGSIDMDPGARSEKTVSSPKAVGRSGAPGSEAVRPVGSSDAT